MINFFKKLRALPEKNKKIILWVTVVIISLVLFFFWFKNFQNNLRSFKKEEFKEKLNFPKLEMSNGNSVIEMPKISEEELKRSLEEMMKEKEQEKQ